MSDTADAAKNTPGKGAPKTPKWRKDFPIEWGADNYVTRRDFTKFLILISGATMLGNGYFVLQRLASGHGAHPEVKVAAVNEVAIGDVKLFRYPTENDPAILLRLSADRFVAYHQRCTHLTCPVQFSKQSGRLECPCHNGTFDCATGQVLSGPPPRPLPRIRLHIADGQIYAQGLEDPNENAKQENTRAGDEA
jgi:Rieske Fe-S protein